LRQMIQSETEVLAALPPFPAAEALVFDAASAGAHTRPFLRFLLEQTDNRPPPDSDEDDDDAAWQGARLALEKDGFSVWTLSASAWSGREVSPKVFSGLLLPPQMLFLKSEFDNYWAQHQQQGQQQGQRRRSLLWCFGSGSVTMNLSPVSPSPSASASASAFGRGRSGCNCQRGAGLPSHLSISLDCTQALLFVRFLFSAWG